MPTPELAIVAGAIILALVVIATVAVSAITSAHETTRAALQAALVLRGVNPHVANPELFGPTGMKRSDEETYVPKGRTAQRPPPDEVSEEEAILREAEAEYFRAREGYDPISGARLTSRPGAPPGANPSSA